MKYKLARPVFARTCSKLIPELFGSLGFAETKPGAFTRPVERILHGFGFTLHSYYPQFCVPVGVDVPCLWPRQQQLMQGDYPALAISRRLGEFRNKGTGVEEWYLVKSDDDLPAVFEQVYHDFVDQALPWLEQYRDLEAVAAEFHRRRIGPLPNGDSRRHDPFAMAVYGWMLEELGGANEAQRWFGIAISELRKPTYIKNGRVLTEFEIGATELRKSDEEETLLRLLEGNSAAGGTVRR